MSRANHIDRSRLALRPDAIFHVILRVFSRPEWLTRDARVGTHFRLVAKLPTPGALHHIVVNIGGSVL